MKNAQPLQRCPKCGQVIRDNPHPLTERQHEVLAFLREYIAANGYAPSYGEIAAHFQFKTQATVHEHLTNLERKGHLRRRYNESRSIELVEATDV
ncbi:MAG TPA: FeoC-like transcriptional regulator [Thermoanaerobaculia bacterium]